MKNSIKNKQYWLIKSEGTCYSIDDLKRDRITSWTGIRNYQARNFMRDEMKVGDGLLFYHSIGSTNDPAGVYGIAQVVGNAHIDPTALDPKDEHYDARAARFDKEGKPPVWICVDVGFVRKFTEPLTLSEIKVDPKLSGMLVARRGMRLSVMPVAEKHWHVIEKLRPQ